VHIRILANAALQPVTFWLAQSARMGALPALRAATDPGPGGAEYFGPSGRNEYTGHPVLVSSSAASHDVAAQRRLWAESERMTGVRYLMETA
jgi:hypothetical protein